MKEITLLFALFGSFSIQACNIQNDNLPLPEPKLNLRPVSKQSKLSLLDKCLSFKTSKRFVLGRNMSLVLAIN